MLLMCCFWMLHYIASSHYLNRRVMLIICLSIVVLIESRILQNTVSHNSSLLTDFIPNKVKQQSTYLHGTTRRSHLIDF
jgi:hypothetical protein